MTSSFALKFSTKFFLLASVVFGCVARQKEMTTKLETAKVPPPVLVFSENSALEQLLGKGQTNPETLQRYSAFSEEGDHWGDAFGLKLLKPVDTVDIIRDFIPNQIISQSQFELEILWRSKWKLQFHFSKPLSFPFPRPQPCANRSDVARLEPFTWLKVSDVSGSALVDALVEIRDHLKSADLENLFLVKNPFRNLFEEIKTYHNSAPALAPIELDRELTRFRSTPNAVLVIPDWHGFLDPYQLLKETLLQENVEWLAFEMVPREAQIYLDSYIQAPSQSTDFTNAEKKLLDFIAPDRISPCGIGLESHYMSILQLARNKKIRTIGLDGDKLLEFFGPKGPQFNGVSNLNWVDALSVQLQNAAKGRGVVFGGREHFFESQPGFAVQDLLKKRHPTMPIFFARDNQEPKK